MFVETTLAGQAQQAGSADGFGGAARFQGPLRLAADNAGNIYVADSGNHLIRKVTATGTVTTVAGLAGNSGSADGTGDAARFNYPEDVAVDAAGNLYVADSFNAAIRKVTPQGEVSTLAGLAEHKGWSDGIESEARFGPLFGLAVDGTGNLFVADGEIIRKVTPSGVVTTLAGVAASGDAGPSQTFSARDGTGSAVRFRDAEDVAVDHKGDLYVVDWIDNTIRKGRPAAYTPYTFTTLAGNAGAGSTDGLGSLARLDGPSGVAVDTAGNLYVADKNNFIIRKVTPAGMVTTLAGMAGIYGSADGTGNGARFGGCGEGIFGGPPFCRGPAGVTVDNAGNVYVVDAWNHTIHKITPAGTATTLAGSAGRAGALDGTASDAQFNVPAGLALDRAGNLYVADQFNSTIRKVTPAGIVTTLAGLASVRGSADGTGSAARFYSPAGVAVDGFDNVYVADSGNNTIRRISPLGAVTTLAGSAGQNGSADGTRSAARFNSPSGVTVDSVGNVYVADNGNNTIRKVTPSGVVTTVTGQAGSYGSADGTGSAARFSSPRSLALDDAGNLYVSDYDNNTIRKVTPGGAVTTLAGLAGGGWGNQDGIGPAALFGNPSGVAVDDQGNAYVTDTDNHTIRKISPSGEVTTLAGKADNRGSEDGTGTAARFFSPTSVAVDSAGILYVADNDNSTIRKITPAGEVTTLAGTAGNTGSADGTGPTAQFYFPYGLAVDSAGVVYVADTFNNTIRRVTPAGDVTTLAGLAGAAGSNDGKGSAARFSSPTGVAVDGAGNIYVADNDFAIIRKVTPEGVVTTLAGCATCPYSSFDGTGSDARFRLPWGIAVDGGGNIYVGGYGEYTIRRITPAGVVTTIAGLAGAVGTDDGTGPAARFGACIYELFDFFYVKHCLGPRGVAVDRAGNIYVADNQSNTIRKGYPAADVVHLLIVASGPGFGFNGGQFGFALTGPANQAVIVEASTDLASWVPIWTNTITTGLTFSDPRSGALTTRFYRVRTP